MEQSPRLPTPDDGTGCIMQHVDAEGKPVPCPGYPHPVPIQQDQGEPREAVSCPHCADTYVDLDAHLETCQAATEVDWQKQVAAARDLIREDEHKRMRACLEEIRAVCAKHGMSLDIEPARVVLRPVD